MYFLELHIHTSLGSEDSFLKLSELIEHVISNRINGIALTEHLDISNCTKQSYEKCYSSYELLSKRNLEFDIIPGVEIKLQSGCEFLIYGVKIPYDICCKSWKEIKEYVWKENGLIIKAHPFRERDDWDQECDGVEVYNSASNYFCNNKAEKMFLKNSIPYIIGTDAHFDYELGKAVLVLNVPAQKYSNEELLKFIKRKAIGGVINGKFKDINGLHM